MENKLRRLFGEWPLILLALVSMCFARLAAAVDPRDIFAPEEFFSGPTLDFVRAIKDGDREGAARVRDANGLDINLIFPIPESIDLLRARKLSWAARRQGDALTLPYRGGYERETTTILNFFIANDDLDAVKVSLDLGADPCTATRWYGNSFTFAAEYRKVAALEILFASGAFERLDAHWRWTVLDSLPIMNTVNHLFGDPEYVLDPKLMEIAKKHGVSFEVKDPRGEYYILAHRHQSGLDVIIWLLKNGARVDLVNPDGMSLADYAKYWLSQGSKASPVAIRQWKLIQELLDQRAAIAR